MDTSTNNDDQRFDNFPPIGGLMVSKMVAEDQLQPGFMYREKRTGPEDSGWRIFSGLESEEYTDDPNNAGIYAPATILKIDPSIGDILLKGVGSVYEKSEDGTTWNKVTDFDMEDDYMVTHRLTDEWTIEINNLFERAVEESGSLLYTTGDKSVRLNIWNDEGKSKEDLYNDYKRHAETRDQSEDKTLQLFDFSDEEIARVGYLIREGDGIKGYGVIYGFSLIDNEILMATLYFDEDEDIDWAIETWKNIKINPLQQLKV
ncbi:MAG: DUF2185 domain-containing protein [Filimonas sp.]|nr:DUF2185 domain-containing protein [Filimonas sp.]